jgi:Predicted 3'-5' exonuclease related to the exonuclease domain of PolB
VLTFDTQTDEAKALRALESAVATSGENPWVWHDASGLRTLLLARALAHGLALPALLAGGLRCVTTQHGLDAAPLHEIAAVHGLPHRLGLQPDEAEALDSLAPQRLTACSEADALMAALLDLGLRQARGETSFDEATACRRRVAAWLAAQTAGHWQQFQQYWAV